MAARHKRAAPHPTPTTYPSPGDPQVPVPANATKAQIDACMAQARADGPGTWVVFPAGKFAYAGTLVVPDRINLTGQGIWDQGAAGGGGGTWLQCPIKWGSYSTIANLLLGFNAAGKTSSFTPCARNNSACGTYTQTHGSTGCTFSFVRFKGGSDTGAAIIDLGSNWVGTSTTIKTIDMIDTSWYDCEFERPQAANSVGASSSFPMGNPGNCLNLWLDDRSGGAQVYGNHWVRCHFGVKNGYHTGIDGYGSGSSCPFMQNDDNQSPTTTGGSVVTTANINTACDWSKIDHGMHDNTFTDCLFEYTTWYAADICDSARPYSMWMGTMAYLHDHPGGTDTTGGASYGWGNPPGSQWVTIPDRIWNLRIDMTRCYHKGNITGTGYGGKVWGAKEICGEIGRNCTVTDSTLANGASLFNQAGHYGNTRTGTFPSNWHPTSSIFTSNWSGATTSYTLSPYDP